MCNNFFSKSNLSSLEIDEKVSIVIPWRPTESRIKTFEILFGWYKENFSNFDIILSDSGDKIFNLSKSRNLGIKKALNSGAEVVVVSDADCFVSKDSLIIAIKNSINNKTLSTPYNVYIMLSQENFINKKMYEEVYNWLEKPIIEEGSFNRLWPCSGVYVIHKDVYEKIGGFDENFIGWGPEDIDYHKRYFDVYGKIYDYIDGHAHSPSDHSREEWQNQEITNLGHHYFINKHGRIKGNNWNI